MMDPLRGRPNTLEALLDASASPADLLERLSREGKRTWQNVN